MFNKHLKLNSSYIALSEYLDILPVNNSPRELAKPGILQLGTKKSIQMTYVIGDARRLMAAGRLPV